MINVEDERQSGRNAEMMFEGNSDSTTAPINANVPASKKSDVTPSDHEPQHWHSLLTRYVGSRMPAFLKRNLGVSDIVQSVLLQIGRRRSQFRGATSQEFQAWLLRIAQHKIIDGLRRFRSRACPPELHSQFHHKFQDRLDELTPSQELRAQEEFQLLMQAISDLPVEIREIVTRKHIQNQTLEEISKAIGLPVTTCRRRWLEGLSILETRLKSILT